MKIVGLLLSLLVVAFVIYSLLPRGTETTEKRAASASSLGAPPPEDIGHNREAAEAYTKRQGCLAACAGEDRSCRALAFEPSAIEKCDAAKAACESRCP